METRHTPGPWKHSPSGLAITAKDAPLNSPICWTYETDITHAERLANARLIAAAPELLEALKRTTADLERLKTTLFDDTIDIARAVLAKAEGR